MHLKSAFLNKQAQLEKARTSLKKEFFGIDKAIDELINNARSWFVLNDYQNRPLVVNLWGLTGVGKTSLISRLAELLAYQDRLFKFDLGDKNTGSSFRNGIEDLCEKNESDPLIIVLDEFQHSRTLKGPLRQEIENDSNRKVWELIDSGKIEYYNWYRGLYDFIDYVNKLKHLVNAGVIVKDGVVVKGGKLYRAEFEVEGLFRDDSDNTFVDKGYYAQILEFAGTHYGFVLLQDVKKHLFKMDGFESIDFLFQVLKTAKKPRIKNFTKALIVIIGNLDEAYEMSSNLTADIDADTFYESSLKITVPRIKKALASRFRSEQIARLGNVHIIYPALNKKAYQNIILNEINKVILQTRDHLDIELVFEASVIELIYKEGVFPTQGARPLLTTINYLIKSNLPVYISEILLHDLSASQLRFSAENKRLICSYISEGAEELHHKAITIETPLEDIRVSKKDDMQAITAVHESGHALISAVLLKVIPDHVYSVTTETDSNGFVYSKFPWKYIAKKDIINRVALYLAGYVAEELVFGKDHVTTGSSSDIQSVTSFLSHMYKKEGLGELPIYYDLDATNNQAIHNVHDVEFEIKETLKKGYALAKETIEKEMKLLLQLSDYLSDHSSIEKEELKKIIQSYKVSDVQFLDTHDEVYYREHLKKSLSNNLNQRLTRLDDICLNYNGINK